MREADSFKDELETHRKAIAERRDKLRDLEGDIADLADCCQRAEEALQEAIEALSELA